MSGELVKYKGLVMSERQALELARREAAGNSLSEMRQGVVIPPLPALPRRVDALRMCAQRAKPWGSIYILQRDGSYEYSGSIQITKTLYRTQYTPGTQQMIKLDQKWIDEEVCAWCGACGEGLFQCGECNKTVCTGLSTGRYFRCYCGAEGWAEGRDLQHFAFVPRSR
jgi:hypothetical protein